MIRISFIISIAAYTQLSLSLFDSPRIGCKPPSLTAGRPPQTDVNARSERPISHYAWGDEKESGRAEARKAFASDFLRQDQMLSDREEAHRIERPIRRFAWADEQGRQPRVAIAAASIPHA